MPPLKVIDVLARYQTTLDRQLSRSIGELLLLKNTKSQTPQLTIDNGEA